VTIYNDNLQLGEDTALTAGATLLVGRLRSLPTAGTYMVALRALFISGVTTGVVTFTSWLQLAGTFQGGVSAVCCYASDGCYVSATTATVGVSAVDIVTVTAPSTPVWFVSASAAGTFSTGPQLTAGRAFASRVVVMAVP